MDTNTVTTPEASPVVLAPAPVLTAPSPTIVVDNWSPKFYFPKNRYTLRIVDKVYKQSKASKPMIEFTLEIVAPSSVMVEVEEDGKKYKKPFNIVGAQAPWWLSLDSSNMARVKDFHKSMLLPVLDINPVAPDLDIYSGLVLNAIVSCDKKEELSDEMDEVTGKQKPILDDDGKPIVKHFLRVGDIIGRNTKWIDPTRQ